MKKTIVLLRGGLGNQMFQYAAGLGIAKKNGSRLMLDTTLLNDRFPRRQITFRTYDLDIFALTPEFTALSKISSRVPVPGLWAAADLVLIKLRDALGIRRIVKEKQEHSFDPNISRAGGDVFLWGFWQTPKYFTEAEMEVRDAFRFRNALQGKAADIARAIEKTNAVALHVRRADYLLPKYKGLYGDTDSGYYEKAVRYIGDRVNNPALFVFSDDIAWCKEHFHFSFPTTFVDRSSDGPGGGFHLQLMSLCKHNIITNSSFSWWGAWLNRNHKKIVIAPKRWTLASGDDEDIIPERWIKL
ncbi:MAG: alpha-1,2-fucosyltransferase [Minisyncoccia bacterium]|jgi:hypothetical protein